MIKKESRVSSFSRYFVLSLFAVMMLLPVVYTVCNSFMSSYEINRYYENIGVENGFTAFHLLPDVISFDSYYKVFVATPDYLLKFWVSLLLTSVIVLGQVVVSVLAGYSLAKFRFPFRDTFSFIIIILMMMPYQVTLVSNYIVLERLGILNSYSALILPGIFSPFGVFLMRQVISTMPSSILEAAKLDGANQLQIIFFVLVPRCKSGIISLVILSFIDYWNMVEQPLIFLDNPSKYPLSVFLASCSKSNIGLSFTCGVLAMIPVVLLFLYFEKELCEGIAFSNLK